MPARQESAAGSSTAPRSRSASPTAQAATGTTRAPPDIELSGRPPPRSAAADTLLPLGRGEMVHEMLTHQDTGHPHLASSTPSRTVSDIVRTTTGRGSSTTPGPVTTPPQRLPPKSPRIERAHHPSLTSPLVRSRRRATTRDRTPPRTPRARAATTPAGSASGSRPQSPTARDARPFPIGPPQIGTHTRGSHTIVSDHAATRRRLRPPTAAPIDASTA
jgi:hypothetical protein